MIIGQLFELCKVWLVWQSIPTRENEIYPKYTLQYVAKLSRFTPNMSKGTRGGARITFSERQRHSVNLSIVRLCQLNWIWISCRGTLYLGSGPESVLFYSLVLLVIPSY